MNINLTLVALNFGTVVTNAEILLDGYVNHYASSYPYSCESCVGPSYLSIVENLHDEDKVILSLQGHLVIDLQSNALKEKRPDVYNISQDISTRVYCFFYTMGL